MPGVLLRTCSPPTAYEKGRDRPPLTVYTFQPPEGHSGLGSPQVCSQPCSPVCLEVCVEWCGLGWECVWGDEMMECDGRVVHARV